MIRDFWSSETDRRKLFKWIWQLNGNRSVYYAGMKGYCWRKLGVAKNVFVGRWGFSMSYQSFFFVCLGINAFSALLAF